MTTETYSGPDAIKNFLRPTVEKMIPLVELPAELNPFLASHDIHISVKLMNMLPLGNVKSLPAWNMLEQAGSVDDYTVVEASSGNTVFSLGMLARHFGAARVEAIASPDVSDDKLALLRLAGVNITMVEGPMCPDPDDPHGAIAVARSLGRQRNHINPGQFDNEHNPAAHEHITGPQLLRQLGNSLGLYCAGMGTTGTLIGTARFLKKQLPQLAVVGVLRVPNNPVPGVRTAHELREVAFDWKDILTHSPVMVATRDSYHHSLQLIRHGLLVGPSGGFAYAGLLQQLEAMQADGSIEALRGKHAVFVSPDSPLLYINEYFTILGDADFPPIKNDHLRRLAQEQRGAVTIKEKTVDEVYADESLVRIDVREKDEYIDHHLPESMNVPLVGIDAWIAALTEHERRKKYVFICKLGSRSMRAAKEATDHGLQAYSMAGGTSEWSTRTSYPRITSPHCKL